MFKCKHPAKYLVVERDSTHEDSAEYPGEYTNITHHLMCYKCQEIINIGYAKPHHDVIMAKFKKQKEAQS